LQVIASLLHLQAESVHDARDATLFARSAERVISMALVHEQLHQAENTALIPFREYLQELVGHLSDASVDTDVRVYVESDDITLAIYRAVPCGLIVNELVTNAIEHAFPRGTGGTITVSFRDHGETYRLEVADTGVGMPEDAERSLGLTLVESLTQQVHATLSVSTDPGTRFVLDVPAVSHGDQQNRHLDADVNQSDY
jgi:two-component sensor histidine kinase